MAQQRQPKLRPHGFIGRIYEVISDEIGFIRPTAIRRMDGGDIGLDVDDDVFVHLNAFDFMVPHGYQKPERLEEGMWIAYFLGPSRNKDGKVTAECCSVYDKDDEDNE